MKKIFCYTIVATLLFASVAFSMERFGIVTTQELRKMLDDRASGKTDFILVNSLDEIIYRNSSIPGSVNVPWSRLDKMSHRLGENKDRLVITY